MACGIYRSKYKDLQTDRQNLLQSSLFFEDYYNKHWKPLLESLPVHRIRKPLWYSINKLYLTLIIRNHEFQSLGCVLWFRRASRRDSHNGDNAVDSDLNMNRILMKNFYYRVEGLFHNTQTLNGRLGMRLDLETLYKWKCRQLKTRFHPRHVNYIEQNINYISRSYLSNLQCNRQTHRHKCTTKYYLFLGHMKMGTFFCISISKYTLFIKTQTTETFELLSFLYERTSCDLKRHLLTQCSSFILFF